MDEATTKIFISVKNSIVGIEDDTSFDSSILAAINTSLSILEDNGVGSKDFYIKDSNDISTWIDFIGNSDEKHVLSMIIFYVENKARSIFDPPTNSILLTALNNQLDEMLYRIKSRIEDD